MPTPVGGISLSLSPNAAEDGLTAGLQKGVIVHLDGRPLCEEGMGFGVPAIRYGVDTYLSFTAVSEQKHPSHGETITKTFVFDAVQRMRHRGRLLTHPWHYAFVTWRSALYQWLRPAQRLLPVWNRLMRTAGLEYCFERCEPLCAVPVTYEIGDDEVAIEVDLAPVVGRGLSTFILNEQGARSFSRYKDPAGLVLEREAISGWAKVKADRASLMSADRRLGFSVPQVPGTTLYRGWELLPDQLAWSGFVYDASRLDGGRLSYRVKLGGD